MSIDVKEEIVMTGAPTNLNNFGKEIRTTPDYPETFGAANHGILPFVPPLEAAAPTELNSALGAIEELQTTVGLLLEVLKSSGVMQKAPTASSSP
jgi:hypothetical protein